VDDDDDPFNVDGQAPAPAPAPAPSGQKVRPLTSSKPNDLVLHGRTQSVGDCACFPFSVWSTKSTGLSRRRQSWGVAGMLCRSHRCDFAHKSLYLTKPLGVDMHHRITVVAHVCTL
jgi:hypothetical protein